VTVAVVPAQMAEEEGEIVNPVDGAAHCTTTAVLAGLSQFDPMVMVAVTDAPA
jgi:hypothetical protein